MTPLPDTGGDAPARTRILAAAGALFAEHGFDRTATAKVAAAAGVPHGLVFYHFATKADLLLAVLEEAGDVPVSDRSLPPPRANADPQRYVRRLFERLSELLGGPDPVRRIVIQELETHPEVRARAMAVHEQITALVADRLAAVVGASAPGPTHRAAAQLLTVTAGLAPLLGSAGAELIDPAAVAKVVVDGLRG